MSSNKIQYFLSAVEYESFTKAAKEHFVTQVAVTQQIAALEKELGVKLFDRQGNKIKVTKAGRYFYTEMRQLMDQYERISVYTKSLMDEKRDVIRIGIGMLPDYEWMNQILEEFRKENPKAEFDFLTGTYDVLLAKLKTAGLFLTFYQNPDYEDVDELEMIPAYQGKISVIVGKKHELYNKKEIFLEDLKDMPVYLGLLENQNKERMLSALRRFCRNAGFMPFVRSSIDNLVDAAVKADLKNEIVVFIEDITGYWPSHEGRKIFTINIVEGIQKYLIYREGEMTKIQKRLIDFMIKGSGNQGRVSRADLKTDYGVLWKEALKLEDGTYSKRLSNDGEEMEFWHRFMQKRSVFKQDSWAVKMSAQVTQIVKEYNPQSILEIGPGWGNFTMDLVDITQNLTCVDISRDVLKFIKNAGKELKQKEIKTIWSKWEDFSVSEQYDVVFGYNCYYRMFHLSDCFKKMNQAARKLCVIGMGMGEPEPYYKDMEDYLGLKFIRDKKDYIYFVNILYQLGIDPNVKVIPLSKDVVYDSFEDVIRGETSGLYHREEAIKKCKEEIEVILKKYFKLKKDRKYHYQYTYRGALVYWEPSNR